MLFAFNQIVGARVISDDLDMSEILMGFMEFENNDTAVLQAYKYYTPYI